MAFFHDYFFSTDVNTYVKNIILLCLRKYTVQETQAMSESQDEQSYLQI